MKRNATFAIPFHTCDFSAAQTTGAVDTDTFGTKTHCRLNGTLHGATECHTAFELLSDRLSDQRSIDFRLTNFNDVEGRIGIRHFGKLLAELFDVCTLLADDDTRTSRVDRHAALLVRTLDYDFGNRSLLEFALKILTDLDVFMQQLAVFTGICVPTRIPSAVDAETKTDRINLLAHYAASPFSATSRTTMVRCENGFSMRLALPRPRTWKRFMTIDLPT